jgi:hypothetical protein
MADNNILSATVDLKIDQSSIDKQLAQTSRKIESTLKKTDKTASNTVSDNINKRVQSIGKQLDRAGEKLSRILERGLKVGLGAGTSAIYAFLKSGSPEALRFADSLDKVKVAWARVGSVLATKIKIGGATGQEWLNRLVTKLENLDTTQIEKALGYFKAMAVTWASIKAIQLASGTIKLGTDVASLAGMIPGFGAASAGGAAAGGAAVSAFKFKNILKDTRGAVATTESSIKTGNITQVLSNSFKALVPFARLAARVVPVLGGALEAGQGYGEGRSAVNAIGLGASNIAGGALGLKIGAAIGTAIAPGIGTAIGGLIGSIAGALTGGGIFKYFSPSMMAQESQAGTVAEGQARSARMAGLYKSNTAVNDIFDRSSSALNKSTVYKDYIKEQRGGFVSGSLPEFKIKTTGVFGNVANKIAEFTALEKEMLTTWDNFTTEEKALRSTYKTQLDAVTAEKEGYLKEQLDMINTWKKAREDERQVKEKMKEFDSAVSDASLRYQNNVTEITKDPNQFKPFASSISMGGDIGSIGAIISQGLNEAKNKEAEKTNEAFQKMIETELAALDYQMELINIAADRKKFEEEKTRIEREDRMTIQAYVEQIVQTIRGPSTVTVGY